MDVVVGDIVRTRKPHPCGSVTWQVLRVGADFKIKCTGCGRIVMMERPIFEKRLRSIEKRKEEANP